MWLGLLSPASFVVHTELGELTDSYRFPIGAMLVNYTWHAVVVFRIRHLCLTRAGQYLERSGG